MTTATQTTVKLFIRGKPVPLNSAYMAVKPRARLDGKKARRRALTPTARAWKEIVTWETYNAGVRGRFRRPVVHLTLQGVRGDVDSYFKLILDAVAAAMDCDDRYFAQVSASVSKDGEPGVWLEIQEAADGI